MEIWTAKAILAPLPGDPVPWPYDPLPTSAWNAGSGAPDGTARRQVRPKLRPARPRRSRRSFLWGISIVSTAMCAGLVVLMASGGLTAVSTPEADGGEINAAAVTPGLGLLDWSGAMAAEHPVTSLGVDQLLLQSGAASEGSDSRRQMAKLVSAEVSRVREAVDDLNLLTSALILQGAVRSSRPFMAELALAMQAAGNDAELLEPLDRLMTWAESGARSQDDLVRHFDAVAEQVRSTEAQADASTIRRATLMMRDVAIWIGIGESETPPSDASLEAASAALGRGMIGEAVATLSDLGDPVEPLVRPWLAEARAKLTIEKEAEHFQRIVLGRVLATRS
jgi:hypothetical protein